MENAITAKLGIDTAGFNTGLKNAQGTLNSAAASMSSSSNAAAGATDNLWKSQNKVNKTMVGLSRTMLTAQDATTALSEGSSSLARAMNLPPGVAIGIGVAAIGVMKLKEAYDKVADANKSAQTELAKPLATEGAMDTESILASIKAKEAEIKKLKDARGWVASAVNATSVSFGGTDQMQKSFENENALEQRREALSRAVLSNVNKEIDARNTKLNISERDGALLEAEIETSKKIAKIQAAEDSGELMPVAAAALKKQAKSDGELKAGEINKKADAKEAGLTLEDDILAAKKSQLYVASEIARLRVEAAQRELDLLKDAGPEMQHAAKLKVEQMKMAEKEAREQEEREAKSVENATTVMEARANDRAQTAQAMQTEIDFAAKLDAARKAGNTRLVAALEDQKKKTLENQAKKVIDDKKEKVAVSLHDLAVNGRGRDAARARRIERIEKQAHKAALGGHEKTAMSLQEKANMLRGSINMLKDGEKNKSEFAGALDKSKVLEAIAKNTALLGKNL